MGPEDGNKRRGKGKHKETYNVRETESLWDLNPFPEGNNILGPFTTTADIETFLLKIPEANQFEFWTFLKRWENCSPMSASNAEPLKSTKTGNYECTDIVSSRLTCK